jgi:hypothetical protein
MLPDLAKELMEKARLLLSRKRKDSGDPDDPFALVGAPVKPRPPLNRSSIAVRPEP